MADPPVDRRDGARNELVVARPQGLYCAAGDFYVDPWRPVDRAVITHAHSDHARPGHAHYLAATAAQSVLRARLGPINLQTLGYGETVEVNGVRVSLHPAGHVLGSAQVRIEHQGEVWVISGDYKVQPDATCDAFEPVRCDTFVTESTFGLPVYRWADPADVFETINAWWHANAQAQRPSVLFCYAFGKAQRILSGVNASIGPIVSPWPTSLTTRALLVRWCWRRPRPRVRPGCVASMAPGTRLHRAGCSCGAHAGVVPPIAASCCPITPTGQDCSRRSGLRRPDVCSSRTVTWT